MARGTLRIYLGRRARRRARPSRCSTRAGGARAAAPTSWSGSSRPTVAPNTQAQIRDLEVVPRQHDRRTAGSTFEEMDVDAIIARAPKVVLVDELAHTNVPGSRNEKRWQDVDELLDAGIDVISTVNVQHLESMNDVVEEITGIKQQRDDPRRRRARGRPDRDRRHDAAGAAAPDGARQHLPGREGRRVARQLLPRGQPRRAARARADVGRRPGRRGARGVPRGARHRRARGRRASGWSSRSPARPVATTSSAGPRGWRRARAASCSASTCGPADGLRGPPGEALAEQRTLLAGARRRVPRARERRRRGDARAVRPRPRTRRRSCSARAASRAGRISSAAR